MTMSVSTDLIPDSNLENLLLFSPEAPVYDQNSGGNRLYEIIKILSAMGYNIYYFVDARVDDKYMRLLNNLGVKTYHGENNDVILSNLQSSGIQFKHAVLCWWYTAEKYIPLIKQLYPEIKIIVDTVDVHWVREERGGIGSHDKKAREKTVYESCDVLLAVTHNDLDHIKQACDVSKKDMRILSNIHHQQATEHQKGKDIIFVGGFRHTPNVQAAIRCYNIFNKFVLDTDSSSTLYIIGSDPPKDITKLHNGANVVVTGYEQDLRSYYANARVLLAPLTWGAGIKGKICEATMNKIPVITSTIGAEGFDFVNYHDCLIANSDMEFVSALKWINECSDTMIEYLTNNAYNKVHNITSESNAKAVLSSILRPLPHVVISIITFNNNDRLHRCLESIKNTNYPNYTILVTDNADSAATKKLVDSYIGTEYIATTSNEYFIKPNNRILTEYSSSDIVLLNDDVEVLFTNWLHYLNQAAYSAGNVCCSGGKSLYPTGELMEAGSCLYNDGTGWNIGNGDNPNAPEYNNRCSVGYVSGSMMYMRRDAIQSIGLLDEMYYPMYYEDSDWQYRGHIMGLTTVYEPKCAYIHHVHSSSGANADKWIERNRRKFTLKFVNHDIESYNNIQRAIHVPIRARANISNNVDFDQNLI